MLGAQSKSPIKQLYLETFSIPLSDIIKTRRMIYMQKILQRPESELIRKIYEALKADPVPDDWCLMVKNDFEEIYFEISEQEIINMDF